MRFREKNKQMALYSAIEAKKVAYQNYKAMLIVWIQSTWINDNGDYVILKSNYAEKLQEAKEEFIRAASRLSITEKRWKMTREEAIEILKTTGCFECCFETDSPYLCNDGGCSIREAYYMALDALIRKTGKWIIDDPIHMKSTCSCCGYYNIDTPSFNYCPYCGAYMERIEK